MPIGSFETLVQTAPEASIIPGHSNFLRFPVDLIISTTWENSKDSHGIKWQGIMMLRLPPETYGARI